MGAPLQILWTNDTHGFFLPVYHAEYDEVDTYAQTAATEGKVGGYAQIAGLVKALRQGIWSQNTLFVDAGDTIDGSPVAQKTRGQAVIPVLNAMGYDAWTPGNRDFAWPKADFLSAVGQMNFPIVSSNLIDNATGQYAFPRYLIKRIGGLKVAILGVTSMVGAGTTGAYRLDGIPVNPPTLPNAPNATAALETSMSNLANAVRASENPDVVIVLSHLGFYVDQKLARNTTGIDVIVGAHTHHNVLTAPVVQNKDGSRNVIVTQAGSHGKYLGRLQLWVSDGKVQHFGNDLIRVSEASLAAHHARPDASVAVMAQNAYAPFQTMFDEVIGHTTTVLERRGDTQSTMTNFLTDALAERFTADLGWFPGIRYGSSVIPGPVTVGDVWNIVSPNFSLNGVVYDGLYAQKVSGAALANMISSALNTEYVQDPYLFSGGDVARFSGRLKYTYRTRTPITLPNGTTTRLVSLQYFRPDGTTTNIVVNGVLQPGMATTTFTMASTFAIPGGVTEQVRMTATNADGTKRNLSAVDEIVSYIRAKGTISPTLDDRTVQADTDPANIATINAGTPSNIVLAPGLAIAADQQAATGHVPDEVALPDFVDFVY